VWLLEEGTRPGELMPIEEDEHGTYILNSRDLRAIEHVQRLVEIGVDSLKIEGRTKSPYYVARAAQGYRRAIDDAVAGRPFDRACSASSRGWPAAATPTASTSAIPPPSTQNYLRGHSESGRSERQVANVLLDGNGGEQAQQERHREEAFLARSEAGIPETDGKQQDRHADGNP
jgi:putative protease